MPTLTERLESWVGKALVIDCSSPFVIIGSLRQHGDDFLELENADLHDLRDTETTRELYVVKTARHGVASNRASLLVRLDEVVAIARLDDVPTK